MSLILSLTIKKEIHDIIIPEQYKLLNEIDVNTLYTYIINLLQTIFIFFNFESFDEFENQIRQNNFRDIKWLLSHLLPYLSNSHELESFEQMYSSKYEDIDINIKDPKYKFTNLQYGRCNRNETEYTEINFSYDHLQHNYLLLVETLKIMSNKMHVNWIDIIPYTINDYTETQLYLTLDKNFKMKSLSDIDINNFIDVETNYDKINWTGLSMDDIYNVLRNDIYENSKKIIWLLKKYKFDGKNASFVSIIFTLLTDNEHILNNVSWNNLNESTKIEWNTLFESFKISLANNENITDINKNIILEYSETINILYTIINKINKDKQLRNIAVLDGYIYIEKKEMLTIDELKESVKYLDCKYFYQLISKYIDILTKTYFGYYYTDNYIDDGIIHYLYDICIFVNDLCIEKKIDGGKNIYFAQQWQMLNSKNKEEILKRLNNKYDDTTKWYITNLKADNNKVCTFLLSFLPKIIVETLIIKGVLTQFKPNEYIMKLDIDEIMNDPVQQKMFEKTNNFYDNSYNYLTLKKYSKMPTVRLFKETENEYNYFDICKIENWYTRWAYNWISQIGLCHRFIHNRIIYITGSTGVGKSTEIPKLFLYYSIAIDYLPRPSVVCSQPRQAPTTNNALFVSKTCGVPIDFYKEITDKFIEFYYIQYHHDANEHVLKNIYHPMLKFVTDGSLLAEIDDQTFLKKIYDVYVKDNIYDVIMIDETHEHNENMDILLSFFKLIVMNNNKLKLVVLSATMDDDEPLFRRFYRDINDNKKYPLSYTISENKLDRINVDRRYHISPPQVQTLFKIEEFYVPTSNEYEIIDKILKNTIEGDIILFLPGVKEIGLAIEFLNKNTSPNVIALPYFSRLTDTQNTTKKKDYIVQLTEYRKKSLSILKTDSFMDYQDDFETAKGNGPYDRIIIVATNILEASSTIQTVKFVVDTGTQKTSVYDYEKMGSKLVTTFISESSRIQRKGRVGRVSSGTAYYLYEEGSMLKNKIQYKIATSDIRLNLLDKLQRGVNEKEFMPESKNPSNLDNKLNHTKTKKESKTALEIIISQYYCGNMLYTYYGNDEHYDYKNYVKPYSFYDTGYDYKTLSDCYGKFYLIHPNELDFERNINGDIVNLKNTNVEFNDKKCIKSKKILSFWKILLESSYINIHKTSKKYIVHKTDFGNIILKFKQNISSKITEDGFIRAIIYGYIHGCETEMIKLATFYETVQYDLKKLALFDTIKKNFKFYDIAINKTGLSSDSLVINELLNEFNKFIESLLLSDDVMSDVYLQNDNTHDIKLDTLYKYKNELFIHKDKFSTEFRTITGDDGWEISYKRFEKILNLIITTNIENKNTEIYNWCMYKNINSKVIHSYLHSVIKMKTLFTKIIDDETTKFIESEREKIDKYDVFIKRDINKFDLCLYNGFCFNVCYKINSSDYYLSLYNPNIVNIYKIPNMLSYKYSPVILTNIIYISNFIFYLSNDIENNEIKCIHNISPKLITLQYNIYTLDKYNNKDDITKQIEELTDILNKRKETYENNKLMLSIVRQNLIASLFDSNLQHAISNYPKTLTTIQNALKEFNDDIIKYQENMKSL